MSCFQKRRKAKKKHLLHKLLALSNEFILFTPASLLLFCARWSCEGPGCAIGDLTPISHLLILHKHTHAPRITHPQNILRICHTCDKHGILLTLGPICHTYVYLCLRVDWCALMMWEHDDSCVCVSVSLIKSVRQIICQEMRHGSPTKITQWTALWQSASEWRCYKIQCWACVCAGV